MLLITTQIENMVLDLSNNYSLIIVLFLNFLKYLITLFDNEVNLNSKVFLFVLKDTGIKKLSPTGVLLTK